MRGVTNQGNKTMPRQAKKLIAGQKSLDAIKVTNSRQEYPDKRIKGLYLVVQPSGAMSWAIRYRHPDTGKPRKFTFGAYPAISLEEARTIAFEKGTEIEKGVDLVSAKRKAREKAADTTNLVSKQVESYFKLYVNKEHRPNTAKQARVIFTNDVLPAWGNRRIDEISKRDFVQLLNAKAATAPIMANRVHAFVSHFSNWLVQQGVLDVSFADGTKKPTTEKARERVLTETEIRTLWNLLSVEAYPFGDITRLLMLTGARKSEIANLRWSEINLTNKQLIIAADRMKGDDEHVIPLSLQAMEIIEALPKFNGLNDAFVFTTTGQTPVSGFSRFKARIDKQMQAALDDSFEAWRLHDVRRTAASGMASVGIQPHIVEAALAHRTGTVSGVAAIYNRHSYLDEKQTALQAWANKLDAIINGDADGNVVTLHG